MPIRSIDDLQQPVKGADAEISQIESGAFTGSLTHGSLGEFSFSLGRFSRAVRARGILSKDRHVIGMLVDRGRPVSHWSFDVEPGDVIFDHLGGDHEGIYKGNAAFATIALGSRELAELMKGEPAFSDLVFWQRRTQIKPGDASRSIADRLAAIISRLEMKHRGLSPEGSDFWMRALVEAFVSTAGNGVPWDGNRGPVKSSLIVREVDDLLRRRGGRAVHISEICQALNISRRSLHRAFADVVGIGPVTYLRLRRLNAAREIFRRNGTPPVSVADVAWNFGFDDVGRFAGYYRRLFGERPSDTAGRSAKISNAPPGMGLPKTDDVD